MNTNEDIWREWDRRAWTDDWSDLCDELGIDTRFELEHDDFNSRQLRKRVNERDRAEVIAAIQKIGMPGIRWRP